LREEVQQEGLTRNLSAFARFLEAASFSQSNQVNISEVARDCAIDRKLAESYFQILEDLLLAQRVRPFTKRAKRRLVQHPKFYFFDAGVYRTLRPRGPLDSPEEIGGTLLESLVYQELRALNSYLHLGFDLHFWRSSVGAEVDFVLYGEKGLIAMEVKSAGLLRGKDFHGLQEFMRDYPQAKAYLLYGGTRKRTLHNIEMLPVSDALPRLSDLLQS
jgi:predicted AAA+ superfamily ATPase